MGLQRALLTFSISLIQGKYDLYNNLDFAYQGTLEPQKKQEILMTNYLNCVYNAICFFMLSVSNKRQVLEMTTFDNPEIVWNLLEKNEKIIFTTAHYGNWEYTTPAFTCTFDRPIAAIMRLTPSAIVNAYLLNVRSRFNVVAIDKRKGASRLISALKNIGIIGILTDQNTSTNEGIIVKFFNKDVRHTPIASLLSLKYNAKIIYAFSEYSKDYRKIHIKFLPPLEIPRTDNLQQDIQSLTQLQSDALEQIIRNNPKEWLWFHRKFKSQYPEIYTYGQKSTH